MAVHVCIGRVREVSELRVHPLDVWRPEDEDIRRALASLSVGLQEIRALAIEAALPKAIAVPRRKR